MRLEGEAMAIVPAGELVEIRVPVGARTASIVFRLTKDWEPATSGEVETARLTGEVAGAMWSMADDGRIDRQRASIDRLLAHLKKHCPELMGAGQCAHLQREKAR